MYSVVGQGHEGHVVSFDKPAVPAGTFSVRAPNELIVTRKGL